LVALTAPHHSALFDATRLEVGHRVTASATPDATGFLLYDVLTFLKPQFHPDVRNDKLRFYVSATGSVWWFLHHLSTC
jgi:hypothetical protein